VKAVVYEAPRQVSVRGVPDARIEGPTGVLVRTTSTNICGYNRQLRNLIAAGKAEPSFIVSHELPLDRAPEAYEHFDKRDDGWTKVVLHPGMAGAGA
jgi:glutathione-independent formaldehyde dehydrogenase